MGEYILYFVFDILLGFVPQAMGCAVCLYAFVGQRLKSHSFLVTSAIFAGVAVAVRLICNSGLIDFGFHTVLIWMLFVVVAITYNKFPVMQSTIGILLSSVLIVVTELITGVAISLSLGSERFNQIMDYDITKSTVQEATLRAMCGIPMNVMFACVALLTYYLMKKHREKIAAAASAQDA